MKCYFSFPKLDINTVRGDELSRIYSA
ncbi:uncharacterized protein METZ01_LOCUS328840, partial [marine metagenome]